MAYRIAVASTDGIVVNQHFGHAERFHIIELDAETGKYEYTGTREVERVAKIGSGASKQLESRGFTVYEAPFPIEPLVEKIINDKLWEVDEWRFPTKN